MVKFNNDTKSLEFEEKEIFTQDLIDTIKKAVKYSLNKLKNSDVDKSLIVKDIVDYNISLKINKLAQEHKNLMLMDEIDFRKKDFFEIMGDLYFLCDCCSEIEDFESHTLRFKLDERQAVFYDLMSWKEILSCDYDNFHFVINHTEKHNEYALYIFPAN